MVGVGVNVIVLVTVTVVAGPVTVVVCVIVLSIRMIGGIYVAHDLNAIIRYSDRILVMRSGRIIAEKMPEETNPVELVRLMRL